MCQSRGGAWRAVLFFLVLALSLMNLGIPSAYAWTDENPPAASQCVAVDVDDASTVIENCTVPAHLARLRGALGKPVPEIRCQTCDL